MDNTNLVRVQEILRKNPELVRRTGQHLFDELEATDAVHNHQITQSDCIQYIQNRIENKYLREKSVIYDNLANIFPTVQFTEIYDALSITETDINDDIDYVGDVDYLGYVGEKAFGIQIKPTTANRATDRANFGNYSVSERMKNSFAAFQEDFSGKVFIVFSLAGEIGNPEIIPEIADEIIRLRA